MAELAKRIDGVTDSNDIGKEIRVNGEPLPFAVGADLELSFRERGRDASITITIPTERLYLREE